ncbi:Conjugal transfer protein TraD [Mesorhizobium sp. NFR06]|jgi:type II secretory pathway component PulK|uniref:conjugal transfer protein TraD n=1 Tax=Mesorhizobium sp. NFR06 TaxID=1566290 RepID=UPI0008E3D2B3|nr:conjugal transfer protein TraD [Mesorhizobium sp. NFR06]SFO85501.1 Conjugal transfer protein TraD [Mesorhizobium sp. NFR06]
MTDDMMNLRRLVEKTPDADLKALEEKARELKTRKVQQLGELVIATGADQLSTDELAGALVAIAETKDTAKREAWAKRGAMFFESRPQRAVPGSQRNLRSAQAQPGSAQSPSGNSSSQ